MWWIINTVASNSLFFFKGDFSNFPPYFPLCIRSCCLSSTYHLDHYLSSYNWQNVFDNRIKHQKELVGKSTATHACILAPGNVSIHNFPVSLCCILNHQKNMLSILSYSFISFIHIIFYSLILFLSPGSSRFSREGEGKNIWLIVIHCI